MTLTILPATLVASALAVHLLHVALPSKPVHIPVVDVFDKQLYLTGHAPVSQSMISTSSISSCSRLTIGVVPAFMSR